MGRCEARLTNRQFMVKNSPCRYVDKDPIVICWYSSHLSPHAFLSWGITNTKTQNGGNMQHLMDEMAAWVYDLREGKKTGTPDIAQ